MCGVQENSNPPALPGHAAEFWCGLFKRSANLIDGNASRQLEAVTTGIKLSMAQSIGNERLSVNGTKGVIVSEESGVVSCGNAPPHLLDAFAAPQCL